MKRYILFYIALAILLAACQTKQSLLPTTIRSSDPSITPSYTPSKLVPTFIDSTTSPPAQVNTVISERDISGQERLTQLGLSILQLLDQGQELSQVVGTLQNNEVTIQTTSIDLDGNQTLEAVVIGNIDGCSEMGGTGIWVVKNYGSNFHIEFSYQNAMFCEVKIIAQDDINNDGLPEVVISGLFTTPMMACDSPIIVIGWQNGQAVNYFTEYVDACNAEIKLEDKDKDGLQEIIVTAPGMGGVGGGPGRRFEQTYILQNGQYHPSTLRYLPSKYRIHVLQDAQIAFQEGNYDLALQQWDKAAHDSTLENYSSQQIDNDQPEKYQPAYALYRMYALYILLGNQEKAQSIYNELNSAYPEGTPGGEFIGLAHEAKELLATSQDPEFVCPAIYDFIFTQYPDFIYHWDWGYNNDGIAEFCPIEYPPNY